MRPILESPKGVRIRGSWLYSSGCSHQHFHYQYREGPWPKQAWFQRKHISTYQGCIPQYLILKLHPIINLKGWSSREQFYCQAKADTITLAFKHIIIEIWQSSSCAGQHLVPMRCFCFLQATSNGKGHWRLLLILNALHVAWCSMASNDT